jgi:hypothetical protein
MFNDDIFNSIRNKKFHPGSELSIEGTKLSVEYDMFEFISYAFNHPPKYRKFQPENKMFGLIKMEERKSTPDFVKNVIEYLKNTFHKNDITCHGFCGISNNSKSFGIHKDRMDVFYLQAYGNIEWSIWESNLNKSNIKPNEGICIYKEIFLPGNFIWIPRGTYHCVDQLTQRIGFSFGIEGSDDPADYI